MTYTITRIYDDGGDWYDAPDEEYASIADARAAAEAYIDDQVQDGDYGQDEGMTSVTISYEITSDDDEYDEIYRYEASLAVDEDALIAQAGGDADCDHEWTSQGEGGCDQNPGVWSVGGTTMLYREHCARCCIVRETTHVGPQRNPGDRDTVRYYRRG